MYEFLWLTTVIMLGGALTGILAGMFGIGGASVSIPVLYEVFRVFGVPEGVRMQLCVGTSLAIIMPTSIGAYLSHRKRGVGLPHVLRIWSAPVVMGVIIGSGVAVFAPAALFKIVFVSLQMFIAIKLLFVRDRWQFGQRLPGSMTMRSYGLFIGLISSLTGTGGGALATAFLTAYGLPIHGAVAVSAGLGGWIAVPGAVGYAIAGWPRQSVMPPLTVGFVSLLATLLMAPISVFTASYGVKIAHMMSRRNLEIALGLFLLAVSVRFLISLL